MSFAPEWEAKEGYCQQLRVPLKVPVELPLASPLDGRSKALLVSVWSALLELL